MHHIFHPPLLIALLCFPLCIAVLRFWTPNPRSAGRWLWRASLVLLLVGITGPALSAARHMIYHDEPTLIAVAAAELHGQPLYHAGDAGDRYALLYGPVAYWVYLPPMLAGIVDLRIYQLWVGLPLLFAGLLLIAIARRADSPFGSGLALLPYAVTVILQSPNEWAMKGDAWMLLFVSVELAAALFLPGTAALVTVAFAAALLVHIKVTAILLACVPIALLRKRFSAKQVLFSSLLAALLLPLPFLVPGVSARNFLFWIQASSRHGIDMRQMLLNAALVIFMALPVLSLLALLLMHDRTRTVRLLRQRSAIVLCCIAACLAAIVTGAKIGAGSWHCAPLAPLFAWITADFWRYLRTEGILPTKRPLAAALIATVVLSQAVVGILGLRSSFLMHWKGSPPASPIPGHLIAQDLAAIVHTHPGTQIQMGYGGDDTYEMTWQRPLLVLLGNHYGLDADQLNETGFAHLPLPQATLSDLSHCTSQVYLIPKGDSPFSMQSLYYRSGEAAPKDLFPEAFRTVFLQHYRKTSTSRYFDLWSCAL